MFGVKYSDKKRQPGAVRDAIVEALAYRPNGATVAEIANEVSARIGETPASSVRSYLRLNTPRLFTKVDRGHCRVREEAQITLALPEQNGYRAPKRMALREAFRFGGATLIHGDCFEWLANAPSNSIEAVVTDPPYAGRPRISPSAMSFSLGRRGKRTRARAAPESEAAGISPESGSGGPAAE